MSFVELTVLTKEARARSDISVGHVFGACKKLRNTVCSIS